MSILPYTPTPDEVYAAVEGEGHQLVAPPWFMDFAEDQLLAGVATCGDNMLLLASLMAMIGYRAGTVAAERGWDTAMRPYVEGENG